MPCWCLSPLYLMNSLYSTPPVVRTHRALIPLVGPRSSPHMAHVVRGAAPEDGEWHHRGAVHVFPAPQIAGGNVRAQSGAYPGGSGEDNTMSSAGGGPF